MTGAVVLLLRVAVLICLYGFLAWALITIWNDLRTQGQILNNPAIPTLTLVMPDEEQHMYHRLEIFIGRSASNDFSIPDDTVSARHARLNYRHNQWWIEDLKSTNGTFLNDERVSVPTILVSGDELRCGQIGMTVIIDETGGEKR